MNKTQPPHQPLGLIDFILLPLTVALWGLAICFQGFRELQKPQATPGPFEKQFLHGKERVRPFICYPHDLD